MKTIILPGYSLHNKEWAVELAESLKQKAEGEVAVHNWEHWRTDGNMPVVKEMAAIKREIGGREFNIIGKSVGSRMAIRVISEFKSQVNKVILCGIASISEGSKKAYKKALSNLSSEKIIVFQNTDDPFVPYSKVREFMKVINPHINVTEKSRSDHQYPYPNDFQIFLS